MYNFNLLSTHSIPRKNKLNKLEAIILFVFNKSLGPNSFSEEDFKRKNVSIFFNIETDNSGMVIFPALRIPFHSHYRLKFSIK